jgi:glyoxylase I family protein
VSEAINAPPTTGMQHLSLTVSDVEAGAAWYTRVLGMNRVPVTFPHHLDEDGGFAVVLVQPQSGVMIGLHHHEGHAAGGFDERRTGLDHIAFGVAERADLDAWTAWLDEQGIEHSGVQDVKSPMPFATVVFRDPDNIQLELFYMAS